MCPSARSAAAVASAEGGAGAGDADGSFFEAREMASAVNTEALLAQHKAVTGGKIRTRFPPEPNGYGLCVVVCECVCVWLWLCACVVGAIGVVVAESYRERTCLFILFFARLLSICLYQLLLCKPSVPLLGLHSFLPFAQVKVSDCPCPSIPS